MRQYLNQPKTQTRTYKLRPLTGIKQVNNPGSKGSEGLEYKSFSAYILLIVEFTILTLIKTRQKYSSNKTGLLFSQVCVPFLNP